MEQMPHTTRYSGSYLYSQIQSELEDSFQPLGFHCRSVPTILSDENGSGANERLDIQRHWGGPSCSFWASRMGILRTNAARLSLWVSNACCSTRKTINQAARGKIRPRIWKPHTGTCGRGGLSPRTVATDYGCISNNCRQNEKCAGAESTWRETRERDNIHLRCGLGSHPLLSQYMRPLKKEREGR